MGDAAGIGQEMCLRLLSESPLREPVSRVFREVSVLDLFAGERDLRSPGQVVLWSEFPAALDELQSTMIPEEWQSRSPRGAFTDERG